MYRMREKIDKLASKKINTIFIGTIGAYALE